MYSLDKTQISRIELDVEAARITINHLAEELVDHICCEVENSMLHEGKSFEEAYSFIKEKTGIKVLQTIQENTLYLTDKNYALMKSSMKVTGNIALILLGIGTVMKIYHWAGAAVTLVTGFALLCFLFFPAAVYLDYKETKTPGRVWMNLSILSGGISFMIGILFKVMHWPGANMLLLVGWMLILLVFLPLLVFYKFKNPEFKKHAGLYLLGVVSLIIFQFSAMFKMFHWPGAAVLMISGSVLLIGIFIPWHSFIKFKESGKITGEYIFLIIISMNAVALTSLVALNFSSGILENFTKEVSDNTAIVQYFEKKNSQHARQIQDSTQKLMTTNTDISKEADRLTVLIERFKRDLVVSLNRVDENTANDFLVNPEKIKGKDNLNVNIESGQDQEEFGKDLKSELDNFKQLIILANKEDLKLTRSLEMLLSTNVPEESGKPISWEEYNFRNSPLIHTLSFLTSVEKNIRLAESACLQRSVQNSNNQ